MDPRVSKPMSDEEFERIQKVVAKMPWNVLKRDVLYLQEECRRLRDFEQGLQAKEEKRGRGRPRKDS
jgi:hypothetical protein